MNEKLFGIINDYEMYLMIEKGIRGRINQHIKRYSEANNKHLKRFHPTNAENYLIYVDDNILYEWALFQHLPYKDLMWADLNIRSFNKWKQEILGLK